MITDLENVHFVWVYGETPRIITTRYDSLCLVGLTRCAIVDGTESFISDWRTLGVKFHADAGSPILARFRTVLCKWLENNGINPDITCEVTVHGKKIKVVEFIVDATGRFVVDTDNHQIRTTNHTYPLKEEVPEQVLKAYKEWKEGKPTSASDPIQIPYG